MTVNFAKQSHVGEHEGKKAIGVSFLFIIFFVFFFFFL